ncbi:DUF2142 domain-containing protein [Paraburkholderia kirstenboschensis]|uniref:DUF2142 domain-containing protein n=1 Tax=Paraburkholderia kirstenboschensis TaxID=1245436 RepID=A0ABZ0EVZ6_9BURK|nr:DUF2142 domain-containing protein [Paraburkholderia kirstenboschensis]WOD20557.1 DUF2142 domain-containing protein [Paraburkholderia kirstenboschensis]
MAFFAIAILGSVLSALIPPLQSPDEPEHINRAYLLAHMSETYNVPGHSTGGEIDSGLSRYEMLFAGKLTAKPDARYTARLAREAAAIRWSGEHVFSDMAGSAPYLPLDYVPQAIGLRIGEALDLSVGASYRVARVAALFTIALIIAVAFAIWPPNALLICVLALPMTMFQIASASSDGLSFAWLVLAASLFMLGSDRSASFRAWHPVLLMLAVFMVVTARPQMLPVLALPASVFFMRKEWRWLAAWAVVAGAAFMWLNTAAHIVDLRMPRSVTTGQATALYLWHPLGFAAVLARTLSSEINLIFYWRSFIGILGWLDRPMPSYVYSICGVGLALAAALSVARISIKHRVLLIGCAAVAILLTFFAMLITWTDQPAKFIVGVQGRYFIAPAVLLAYSFGPPRGVWWMIICGAFVVFTTAMTVSTLLWTYYL